jgi:hypothetical protein
MIESGPTPHTKCTDSTGSGAAEQPFNAHLVDLAVLLEFKHRQMH